MEVLRFIESLYMYLHDICTSCIMCTRRQTTIDDGTGLVCGSLNPPTNSEEFLSREDDDTVASRHVLEVSLQTALEGNQRRETLVPAHLSNNDQE